MGNYINPHPNKKSFLLLPVEKSLNFLASWKKASIETVIKTYQTLYPSKVYLSFSHFSKILNQSISDNNIRVCFSQFSKQNANRINILEFFSVIITYALTDLLSKISLFFAVFDFDHSKQLNRDEMGIMCLSFLNGIRMVTYSDDKDLVIEEGLKGIFQKIDMDFDGNISENELYTFINENPTLSKLMRLNLARIKLPHKKTFLVNSERGLKVPTHRERKSNSLIPLLLLSEPSKKDFVDIFHISCNRSLKAQARILYENMMKHKKFESCAEKLYFKYHFKLKTELTLSEFLNFHENEDNMSNFLTSKFANRRRKGFLMRSPHGVVEKIMRNNENKEEKLKKKLFQLFVRFDINKDGFVDVNELKINLKDTMSEEAVEEIFKMYDENQDNLLNFEEFYKLFTPSTENIEDNDEDC